MKLNIFSLLFLSVILFDLGLKTYNDLLLIVDNVELCTEKESENKENKESKIEFTSEYNYEIDLSNFSSQLAKRLFQFTKFLYKSYPQDIPVPPPDFS